MWVLAIFSTGTYAIKGTKYVESETCYEKYHEKKKGRKKENKRKRKKKRN